MKSEQVSVAVLCGGKSRRMGQNKAKLCIGEKTFLEQIVENFRYADKIEEVLLSVRKKNDYAEVYGIHVEDLQTDQGPLMGMYSVIQVCSREDIWIMSCDMPLIDWSVAEYLYPYLLEDVDAVIPVDQNGKKYMLCAWYKKSAGKRIKEQLDSRDYKVQHLLDKLRVCYVAVEGIPDGKRKFQNINTMEEYNRIQKEKKIPVVSFVAYSGTGKTTFLEKLIPDLKKRGLRLAVVKHDGHNFQIDYEGKDSDRFTKAGADVTGLISSEQAVLIENRKIMPERFIGKIQNVDLILTEGFKREKWPKIMLHRKANGKPVPLPPEKCLAVVSDDPQIKCAYTFELDEVEKVADFLVKWRQRIAYETD